MKRLPFILTVGGLASFATAMSLIGAATVRHDFDLPFRLVQFTMVAGIVLLMIGIAGWATANDAERRRRGGFEVKLSAGITPVIEKKDETTHG